MPNPVALIIEARQGLLTQTGPHSHLVNLLCMRNIVLAIDGMDLVGYAQDRFDQIVNEFHMTNGLAWGPFPRFRFRG